MVTAEEILKEINPLSERHDIAYILILKAMKLYANQKLEEAAETVNLQRDWKSSDGSIVETDYTDGYQIGGYRYTVNKQSILALKDEV